MASSNCRDFSHLWVEKLLRFQTKTYRSQWCHTWVHSCLCRVAKANGNTQNWFCVLEEKHGMLSDPSLDKEFICILSIHLSIYLFIHLSIYPKLLSRHEVYQDTTTWDVELLDISVERTLETRHPPMGQHGKGWQHLTTKSLLPPLKTLQFSCSLCRFYMEDFSFEDTFFMFS